MFRLRLALSLAIVLALPAPIAFASAYSQVLGIYEQTGAIPSCKFSSAQLVSASKGVDTYGAQYFADFTNAIQSALAARASGACEQNRRLSALGPGTGLRERAAGSLTSSTAAGLPAPIVLLGVLGGLFALLAGSGLLARARGWDPVWAAVWRHAWATAGWRVGGAWAEFRDWLRST